MYQVKKLFHYLVLSTFLMFATLSTTACSLQKKIASKAGMRSNAIRIGKLGSEYKKFENTEYDFFNPKKKVTKLTKRKPINIKYNTFRVNSLDKVILDSNILYAKYKFADIVADQFSEGMDILTTKKLFDFKVDEMRDALRRRDPDKINQIRKIKNLYKSIGIITTTSKSLVTSATDLKESCSKIKDSIPKDFSKDPIKAVMVPQMLVETKNSISRLADVIQGTPSTISKIAKIKNLLDLDQQYGRIKEFID